MSRNVKGSPPSAVNPTEQHDTNKTAVTIFDLSDEDGYSAVEDITDAEDNDEEDVDAVEEENIRTEAVFNPHSNPRPFYDQYSLQDDYQDDQQDEQHCCQHQTLADILDEAIRFQNYSPPDTNPNFDDFDDGTSWAGIVSDNDINLKSDLDNEYTPYAPDVPDERRVRFDVPSSESDSTDSDRDHHDLFPDIFISENVLDPGFRKEIEFDVDNESSGSATSWDCTAHQEERPNLEPETILRRLSAIDTFSSTAQTVNDADRDFLLTRIHSFDDYETDGDTTEEDTPEPPVRRKTRRPSVTASEVTDLESEPVEKQRGQPRLGRFKLDRSDKKPIAVLNTLTRKMMIFTPHRRHQLDLSPEQFNLSWSVEEQSSPLVRSSSNLGLDAMLSHGPLFDSRLSDTQDTGPAESFVPAVQCSSDSIQGDNESEKKLDMDDFLTFGEEGPLLGDENSNWQPSSTPLRPTTASSEIDVLSHLNSDTVGAFRRNQINQQLILSSQATPDSLAFSGPYNFMALKGLKSDRVETAAIPLTPARRLKHMKEMVRSPLEAASAKRKASDKLGSEHKRHRSISDVNLVQT